MPARLGVDHHASVMTEDMARKLRSEYVPYKNSFRKLAAENGLKQSTVRDCVYYRSYKCVC